MNSALVVLGALLGFAAGWLYPQVAAALNVTKWTDEPELAAESQAATPEPVPESVPEPVASKRAATLDIRVPHPVAAMLGAVLVAAIVWATPHGWASAAYLYIGAVSVLLFFIDLQYRRLPNAIVYPSFAIVASLLLLPAIADSQWDQYLKAWIAAVVVGFVYLVLALIIPGGIGIGDIKLSAVLGLALGFLGFGAVVLSFFAAFVSFSLVAIGLVIIGTAGLRTRIPFGPFMILGGVFALIWGQRIIDWYLNAAMISQ